MRQFMHRKHSVGNRDEVHMAMLLWSSIGLLVKLSVHWKATIYWRILLLSSHRIMVPLVLVEPKSRNPRNNCLSLWCSELSVDLCERAGRVQWSIIVLQTDYHGRWHACSRSGVDERPIRPRSTVDHIPVLSARLSWPFVDPGPKAFYHGRAKWNQKFLTKSLDWWTFIRQCSICSTSNHKQGSTLTHRASKFVWLVWLTERYVNPWPKVFLDGSSLLPIMNGGTRDEYSKVSTNSGPKSWTTSLWIPGKVISFIVGTL